MPFQIKSGSSPCAALDAQFNGAKQIRAPRVLYRANPQAGQSAKKLARTVIVSRKHIQTVLRYTCEALAGSHNPIYAEQAEMARNLLACLTDCQCFGTSQCPRYPAANHSAAGPCVPGNEVGIVRRKEQG